MQALNENDTLTEHEIPVAIKEANKSVEAIYSTQKTNWRLNSN